MQTLQSDPKKGILKHANLSLALTRFIRPMSFPECGTVSRDSDVQDTFCPLKSIVNIAYRCPSSRPQCDHYSELISDSLVALVP